MNNILKSTLQVTLLSLFGALSAFLFKVNYFAVFLLLFVFQYILLSFVLGIINNYQIEKTKQKELDLLEPLSTILECAYCKFKNLLIFIPDENERVEFECTECKNKNLVNIQFVVARVTEPVIVPSTTGISLNDINDEK